MTLRQKITAACKAHKAEFGEHSIKIEVLSVVPLLGLLAVLGVVGGLG